MEKKYVLKTRMKTPWFAMHQAGLLLNCNYAYLSQKI
jgi:hypothetical protein